MVWPAYPLSIKGFYVSRRSSLATVLFLALTTPFGIAAHLISELAGLGWHDGAEVAFSLRHGYLALLAIASLVGFLAVLRGLPPGQRRAEVAALVDELPFRGRGVGFTLTSLIAQFVFFALTQLGEGCPLCNGDILTGVLAAAIASALGALAVACSQRRLLTFALTLIWYVAALSACVPDLETPGKRRARRCSTRRTPFSFRYRPPPLSFELA